MHSIKILNSEAEDYSKESESILLSLGDLKQGNLNRTSLIKIIPKYDVLIVRLGNHIDKEIIDAGVNFARPFGVGKPSPNSMGWPGSSGDRLG